MELRQQQTETFLSPMSIDFMLNDPGTNLWSNRSENRDTQTLDKDGDELMDDAEQTPNSPLTPTPDAHDDTKGSKGDSNPVVQIEFKTQWVVKKDAQWEIIKGKKAAQSPPGPKARGLPNMWAENLYDAQDVLPYFSVGQTILTSKTPRVFARSALLTKTLEHIKADWRSGDIRLSIHLRYKLDLTRPRKWVAPPVTGKSELVNPHHKPPDPPQFRKLMACRDTGVPVRLFATGDFPTLPIIEAEVVKPEIGPEYTLESNNWKEGLVMLGFFWVKEVKEVDHNYKDLNFDLGKVTGQARWDFEFQYCGTEGADPPWWCPIEPDDSESETESDFESVGKVKLSHHPNTSTSALTVALHDDMDWDDGEEIEHVSRSHQNAPQNSTMPIRVSQAFGKDVVFGEGGGPKNDEYLEVEQEVLVNPPTRIKPGQLGLQLEPRQWSNPTTIRPPQIRTSLLLGWHCIQCGRLNPRVEWIASQACPTCKTVVKMHFPQWHRKAHTELSGPIGTLYRLDDGGHTPKVGLHQMAVRDPTNGRTCVEYWLADPPMPILAELNQTKPTRRGGAPRKASTNLPKAVRPQPSAVPNIPAMSQPSTGLAGETQVTESRKPRDAAGSRANLPRDTRMLFTHITSPQHEGILAVPDRVFSGFASMVPMIRQVNNATYRTGASPLSCHYTYFAGYGTNPLHSSSPAVEWEKVPKCVHDAQSLMVDLQAYSVDEKDAEAREFNQSVFVVGNGASGINSFKMVHKAEDGPVGYMVFGASCDVQLIVGDGEGKRRTTKAGALRRAEVLMAHGDALFTSAPRVGDAPIEVRVKRNGLSIVVVSTYVNPEAVVERVEPVPSTSSNPKTRRTLTRGTNNSLALQPATPGLSAEPTIRKRKSDVL